MTAPRRPEQTPAEQAILMLEAMSREEQEAADAFGLSGQKAQEQFHLNEAIWMRAAAATLKAMEWNYDMDAATELDIVEISHRAHVPVISWGFRQKSGTWTTVNAGKIKPYAWRPISSPATPPTQESTDD